MSYIETGYLLQTGPLFGKRTFEVVRKTASNLFLRELEWSRDCVNEKGVMYRTDKTLRLKITNYLHKKGVGSFDVVQEKREVRDRIPARDNGAGD